MARQLLNENQHYNVWRLSSDVVPVDGTQVLCYNESAGFFLAYYDKGWKGLQTSLEFYWQVPSKPLI